MAAEGRVLSQPPVQNMIRKVLRVLRHSYESARKNCSRDVEILARTGIYASVGYRFPAHEVLFRSESNWTNTKYVRARRGGPSVNYGAPSDDRGIWRKNRKCFDSYASGEASVRPTVVTWLFSFIFVKGFTDNRPTVRPCICSNLRIRRGES